MTGALAIGLRKETRALTTTWALAAAAMIAMSWWGALQLGIAAYIAGAVFLGAESVGHEYANRTLPGLLSLPIDRRRIYIQKQVVLIAMLLLLAAVQWAVRGAEWQHLAADRRASVWLLPIVASALMAPWMTMIARSVLGGASLTCFVAGMTWIALLLVPIVRFGSGADEAGAIALASMPRLIVAMSAIAAVLGWLKFLSLEAIDGDVAVLILPRWTATTAGVRAYRPWRAMISKELHLQQLTFGITIQYFVVWGLLGWLLHMVPAWSDFPFAAITTVYCMILPLVIGASACAEERQHGMHASQLLQPVSAWQQWIAKAGVAFALSLLLGVGVPVLLAVMVNDEGTSRMAGVLVMGSILLTASGLYLSSLSTSAARALISVLPAGVVLVFLVQITNALSGPTESLPTVSSWLQVVAVLSVVLVGLAFVNHRSTERHWSRILTQALSIAVVVVVSLIAAR